MNDVDNLYNINVTALIAYTYAQYALHIQFKIKYLCRVCFGKRFPRSSLRLAKRVLQKILAAFE